MRAHPSRRFVARVGYASLVTAGLALASSLSAVALWRSLPSGETLGASGDPGPTAYMEAAHCPRIERSYRPLSQLDPRLVCSVVYAEDGAFFQHDGIDWAALRAAAEDSLAAGHVVRGASTIPMQLARNLYLSAERSLRRKVAEMAISLRLSGRHERLRLLEVYLNAAEWAPCVYGAEAGARHYLGRGAERLDLAEATFLAVLLPRPAHAPGSLVDDASELGARQRDLLGVMRRAGLLSPLEKQRALAEVDALWRDGWRERRSQVDAPAPRDWFQQSCLAS
jgi:monofunctional biosynthetic peptidoglycan transglycosylase